MLTLMYTKDGAGPWKITSASSDSLHNWCIRNELTGKVSKIGPVGNKRVNYYDRACVEAERRNYAYWLRHPPKLHKRDIVNLWRPIDREQLEIIQPLDLVEVRVQGFTTRIAIFEKANGGGWTDVGFFGGYDRVIPKGFSGE